MCFVHDPNDKHIPATYYTFEQDLETPWPASCCESGVDFFLKAELTFSSYTQPGKFQLFQPPNGALQISVMTKQILESGLHSDFYLISGDGDGDRFPCHKNFLSASSRFFATMFKTDMKENRMCKCELNGSTKEGVSALLKFIYYQAVQEPLENAALCLELLHLALLYDIPCLANWARDTIIRKPKGWWDLEGAINLYFRVRLEVGLEELTKIATHILKS